MQTMCTAVAQVRAGMADAGMAEASPDAPIKTFVRLHDEHGRPMHRLGEKDMRVVRNSRLGALLGAERVRVRYNHRFVLDPALHEPLAAAGLSITGLHADRDLADAIELSGHPFFIGLQGHPELTSRPGTPHPVIAAFLEAAAKDAQG
jgi:CTP synthase